MSDRKDKDIDEALTAALTRGVRRHEPTPAFAAQLRAKLDAVAAGETPVARQVAPPSPRRRAWAAPFVSACAAAALVVVALRFGPGRAPAPGGWELADEVVSDHLRVVASSRPIEIESGGIHQVKPWFTGRLDFAPRVAFAGDDDFVLVGGSVGYVRDRKAAVFQFKRRLHAVTLLVFPADGLAWPAANLQRGRLALAVQAVRGYTSILWRDGELGYALVSDVARPELETLATKIND
ncbi:MAG TPA: hypothetical protein VHJ20_07825 [Polyangia bacterium]|nr:hypothetical protein [Polyangia bacterium]